MERNLKNQNHIYRLDKFKVPAAARGEFLARVRTSNEILRAIPGFVEDCLLEQLGASGDSKSSQSQSGKMNRLSRRPKRSSRSTTRK